MGGTYPYPQHVMLPPPPPPGATKELTVIQLSSDLNAYAVKADFHSVEYTNWKGNRLFTRENVGLNWNRMLRVTNIVLCQIQFARKILLGGNQP